MSSITLHHADIIGQGEACNIARATLDTRRPKALHVQDFPELLWVQNGRVRFLQEGGHSELAEGDLVFVRPGQPHALQGRGTEPLVVSVAFCADLITEIGTKHPALTGQLFWSSGGSPVQVHRDMRQLADLNHAALRLERSRRDGLEAEAFLLPLAASLLDADHPLPADAPPWLATACAAARDPAIFRKGAAGFVKAAGRAHPHVSRTTRKFLQQSPSEFVNVQRMAYAARKLTGTADPLAEIAADCGVPNMSHFHRLFRNHHGLTPAQYRQRLQRNMVQPL
jgi:AraC family cel operon transcriptional repressor